MLLGQQGSAFSERTFLVVCVNKLRLLRARPTQWQSVVRTSVRLSVAIVDVNLHSTEGTIAA